MRIARLEHRRTAFAVAFSALVLSLSPAGCGSNDSNGDGSNGGSDGGETASAGDDGGGNEPAGGTGSGRAGRGNTGTGGSGAEAGEPGGEPGGAGSIGGRPGVDPGDDGPGYDGVDLDGLDLSAPPAGCLGTFDPADGSMLINLDEVVPVALVSVVGGIININETPCESEAGDPIEAETVFSFGVSGSAADESLYIDGAAAFGPVLLSDAGGFVVDLGAGDDQLVVLGSDAEDHVSAGSQADAVIVDFTGDADLDILATNVESLLVSTGPKPDVLRADGAELASDPVAVPVSLFGGGANDLLSGGASDDELVGGIGNDTFDAGTAALGADHFVGDEGSDAVDYSHRSVAVSVTLVGFSDDGESGERDEVDVSVEDVFGGDGDDTLNGSDIGNQIDGGPGNDTIAGGGGIDTLSGGDGEDIVHGDDGTDFVYGDAGDDDIHGDAGDDTLDGGGGADAIDGGDGDGDICSSMRDDTVIACEL